MPGDRLNLVSNRFKRLESLELWPLLAYELNFNLEVRVIPDFIANYERGFELCRLVGGY